MAKHWRNITVDGETYRWRGRSYLVVQNSEGRRVAEGHMHKVKGLDPDIYERGKWKGTQDGMVTPEDIAGFIRMSLAKAV